MKGPFFGSVLRRPVGVPLPRSWVSQLVQNGHAAEDVDAQNDDGIGEDNSVGQEWEHEHADDATCQSARPGHDTDYHSIPKRSEH